MLDLKIINGTLFIPGVGLVKAGVGVKDGKIAAIAADEELGAASNTIDAEGKYVTPGWIDPHVHLGIMSTYEGECESETRYALAGGITTIGVFMGGGDSYLPVLEERIKIFEEKSSTDAVFHLAVFTPQQMSEMEECYRKFGVTDFKFYMTGVKGVFPNVEDDFIKQGFEKVARMGFPAIGCVHCEDQAMVDAGWDYVSGLKEEDRNLKTWTDSSPAGAEANAAKRFVGIVRETGARGYMVHMSSKESVQELTELFREGRENIYIETTSAYCCMNNEDPMGKYAKMVPPIREKASQDALWEAVRKGIVSTFGSDNVTCTGVHKSSDKWMEVAPGYPVVGDQVSALLTEGYHKRGVSWMTIIEKVTKGPAEAYGIYPRKGTIAVGSDADLVILDLDREKVVDPKEHDSFADYSLFQGRTFKGLPVKVIKGGVLAAENGKVIVQPGIGKYLSRKLDKEI